MTQHLSPHLIRRMLVLVAATATLIMVIAGCTSGGSDDDGHHPDEHGPSEHYSAPPGLPAGDPATVLTTALAAIFSWEPVTDDSPTDALARAQDHLTGEALASARAPGRGVRASAQWQGWRTSGDLISARVENAQATITSPGRAIGQATVIQTILHRGGGATPYRHVTALVRMALVDGQWKLAAYPDLTE